ncbi:MAG: protein kinase [Candidatus Obscuribacterales bacterium]|nr:protein kinase [Candidatus Obscuribacterales bacterium]
MQSSYGEELGVGDKIAGRYEVLSVLGKGSFGVVFKAKHEILGRIVAIKTLRTQRIVDDRSAKRFEREAKAACLVDHPNIIKVHDFGYSVEDGVPFLVMDFISGIPLYNILKEERCITPERTVLLFSQVCDGLYHAHQRGVIHRDLKPANIMVVKKENEPETVRIVDLGVAKIVAGAEAAESEAITRTGEVCGSPIYLSPEQCVYSELDHKTDIYSLGVCLYESLTGVPPLRGETVYDTIYMHVNESPKPFKTVAPDLDIPASLEEIVMRCLSKRPCDRFESMQELKQALLNALKEDHKINVLTPEELFLGGAQKKGNPGVSGSQPRLQPLSVEQPRAAPASVPLAPDSKESSRIEIVAARSDESSKESNRQRKSIESARLSEPKTERQGLADTISQRFQKTDTTWRVIACLAIFLAIGAGVYAFYIQQTVELKLKLQQQLLSANKPAGGGAPSSGDGTPAPVVHPHNGAAMPSVIRSTPPKSAAGPGMPPKLSRKVDKVPAKIDVVKVPPAIPAKIVSKANGKTVPNVGNPQDGTAAMAFAGLQLQKNFQDKPPVKKTAPLKAVPPAAVTASPAEGDGNPLMQAIQQVIGPDKAKGKKVATAVQPPGKTAGARTLQQMDARFDPRSQQIETPQPSTNVPGRGNAPVAAPAQNQPLSNASENAETADRFYRKGYAEFERGEIVEAVKSFQKAYDRARNDQYKLAYAKALTQCAFVCNKGGDYAGAVTYQQRACELYPDNEGYQRNLEGYQSNKQRGVQ